MLRKPLTPIEDDTEDAPWMVMGTPQSEAADDFYSSLRNEMRARSDPLFVAMFLPVLYYPIPGGKEEQLAPDVLAARVPLYSRSSYSVEHEGVPPAFVLEVVSPESRKRDAEIKPERYERMGVEEYALFAPMTAEGREVLRPPLQGYRRDRATGEFVRWEPDEQGRLWSEVLGLWLALRDAVLRAQRADGSWALTLVEETEARRRAEAERDREARARQQLEEELARLRARSEERE